MSIIEKDSLPRELQGLYEMHPTYSDFELQQAHSQLMRHFEDAWQMFQRLKACVSAGNLNLTEDEVNPTVKPQSSNGTHPLNPLS
jgi:hypothetical protein